MRGSADDRTAGQMGWTRETAYDEEFVAKKHRQLREAGWTVITTGAPVSGELLRQLWGDVSSARPVPSSAPRSSPLKKLNLLASSS